MNKKHSFILVILSILLLASCGEADPPISHIVVKSDRLGVLLDSKDNKILSEMQHIFYGKEERPDGGPEFRYFIDLTIDGKTERWQYSTDGFIRNYNEGHSMIYKLRDVTEFNRLANINE